MRCGLAWRTGPDDNSGAVLDNHKRADVIFLRQMLHELKNCDATEEQALTRAIHVAATSTLKWLQQRQLLLCAAPKIR